MCGFLWVGFVISVWGQVDFEPPRQFAAGEHDAPPATLALEADIRAEADNGPFIRAAGMRFA